MAAQGWDIASVTDDAKAAAPAGWDVAGETSEAAYTGRPLHPKQHIYPHTLDEATNLTGPRGLPASFNTQDSVPDQLAAAGDTALTAGLGIGTAVAKGVTNLPSDLANMASDAEFHGAGPHYKNPVAPFIDEHLTYHPHTQGAKELFGGIGDAVSHATDAIESVPGVKPVIDAAKPALKVGGDLLAAAPVAGAIANTARGISEGRAALAAARADVPVSENMVQNLGNAGYRISPSSAHRMTGGNAAPNHGARIAEAAGGDLELAAANKAHNKPVSNGWAATDIGLPRDTVLTPENIANAKVLPTAEYRYVAGTLADAAPVGTDTAAALRATNAPDTLGRGLPAEHGNSMELLSSEPMTGQDLMDRIAKLRQEGYKRKTPAAPGGQVDPATEAYADAQLDAANALEQELTNRVARTNPQLLGRYQAARKTFAKIGAVERSMKGYDIDPAKVARMSEKSDALDGGLKIIADAHTHAPTDVGHSTSGRASLQNTAATAGATGVFGSGIALATGHPVSAGVLAAVPVTQTLIRRAVGATRGERVASELPTAETAAGDPLSHYFRPPVDTTAPFTGLEPPPGRVFEPHQPSILRSGENVPVAEQGGLPPSLTLAPGEGPVIEPHQPGVLRTGERVPASESTQTPQPSVSLTAPSGQAFDPNQHMLPFGAEPAIDVHHGTAGTEPFHKFEDSKIGAGSGMQARGYGHYVTDSKAEASGHAGSSGGFVMHGKLGQDTVGRMLDLDRPISEQAGVLAALGDIKGVNPRWTGEQLHAQIASGKLDVGIKVDKSGKAIANWLASKGIPGAKFASSKAGKKTGARTYVVYNPDDVAILGNTRIKGNLGDTIAPKTQVGGALTADDLKLAE